MGGAREDARDNFEFMPVSILLKRFFGRQKIRPWLATILSEFVFWHFFQVSGKKAREVFIGFDFSHIEISA